MRVTRISWHGHDPRADFLVTRQHGTIEQYLHWLTTGAYSAVLLDASLLQITYDLIGSEVVAHRLAYIPCPFIVDTEFLEEGNPIDEVVGMYVELSDVALRSPIRFDYDLRAGRKPPRCAHNPELGRLPYRVRGADARSKVCRLHLPALLSGSLERPFAVL